MLTGTAEMMKVLKMLTQGWLSILGTGRDPPRVAG
jgi:hypothetical protein